MHRAAKGSELPPPALLHIAPHGIGVHTASHLQASFVAPVSELEQQVAAIWQQVLTVERVGRSDHFFELGGHSLLAVNVVSRLQLELGLKLTPQLIFQYPVLTDFVSRLAAAGEQVDTLKLSKLDALLDEMEEA